MLQEGYDSLTKHRLVLAVQGNQRPCLVALCCTHTLMCYQAST